MTSGVADAEKALLELITTRAESEGLTPPVLQDIVEELIQQEGVLLLSVYSSLAQEYKNTQPPASGACLVDEAAIRLGSRAAPSSKEEKQLARLAGQHKEISSRILNAQEAADSLRAAAKLQGHVEEFDSLSAAGEYVAAAKCAARAAQDHQGIRDSEPEERMLLDALAERATGLAQQLAGHVGQCISCQQAPDGSCQLQVYPGAGLESVWEALQILSEAEAPLQHLASQICKFLLLPLIAAEAPVAVSASSGAAAEGGGSILSVAFGSVARQSTEEALLACFSFIAEHVLHRWSALMRLLGGMLWPEVSRAYIDRWLRPAVPDSDQAFLLFEALAAVAQGLEASVAQAGFLASTSDTSPALPIHSFARHTLDKWLQKQRLELVAEARSLILAPDHDTLSVGAPLPPPAESTGAIRDSAQQPEQLRSQATASGLVWGPEGVEGPLLAQGVFQISKTGQAIVDIMHRGLEQACSSGSPAVAASMLHALRDVAALYAALPPAIQKRELQVPQLAALFYSNCQHIAQQLLLLPHCYPVLQQLASRADSLADDALRLRAAGQACLDSLAEQQGRELRELLAGAEGFAHVQQAQRGIKARKAVQQALHPLRRLGAVLRPVLPQAAFVAFSAAVLQAAASKVVDDVLAILDISVEASDDLPRILDPLANESAAMFAGTESEQASGSINTEALVAAIEQSAPALLKLKEVLEILGARLVEIQSRWQNGHLQRVGFTVEEVCHLVEAVFEETDLRQAVLQSVRQ